MQTANKLKCLIYRISANNATENHIFWFLLHIIIDLTLQFKAGQKKNRFSKTGTTKLQTEYYLQKYGFVFTIFTTMNLCSDWSNLWILRINYEIKLVLRKKSFFLVLFFIFYWHSITNITWQNQTKFCIQLYSTTKKATWNINTRLTILKIIFTQYLTAKKYQVNNI